MKKEKILFFVLAITFAFSSSILLFSCGNAQEKPAEAVEEVVVEEAVEEEVATEEEAVTEEAEDESGSGDKPIFVEVPEETPE